MKQKLPRIVIIAILTLITATIWAFFDITRVLVKKPDTKVEESAIVPLDPKLDTETLNTLQSSTFFEEGQVPDIVPATEPSPEATPEPTLEAEVEPLTEPSIEPESSPSASPEATI